jgi:hypothetical protein
MYINNNLERTLTLRGTEAAATTENRVGLWCHSTVRFQLRNFRVSFPDPCRPVNPCGQVQGTRSSSDMHHSSLLSCVSRARAATTRAWPCAPVRSAPERKTAPARPSTAALFPYPQTQSPEAHAVRRVPCHFFSVLCSFCAKLFFFLLVGFSQTQPSAASAAGVATPGTSPLGPCTACVRQLVLGPARHRR